MLTGCKKRRGEDWRFSSPGKKFHAFPHYLRRRPPSYSSSLYRQDKSLPVLSPASFPVLLLISSRRNLSCVSYVSSEIYPKFWTQVSQLFCTREWVSQGGDEESEWESEMVRRVARSDEKWKSRRVRTSGCWERKGESHHFLGRNRKCGYSEEPNPGERREERSVLGF